MTESSETELAALRAEVAQLRERQPRKRRVWLWGLLAVLAVAIGIAIMVLNAQADAATCEIATTAKDIARYCH